MDLHLSLSPTRRRSLVLAAACVLFAGGAFLLPFVPFKLEMTMSFAFLVVAVAWAVRRKLEGSFDWFEFFLIFAVLNFTYFGVGTLWFKAAPEELWSVSLRNYITPALVVGLVGFLAAAAGYATLGGKTRPSPMGRYVPAGSSFYVFVAVIGFVGQLGAIAQGRFTSLNQAGFSPLASTAQQFAPLFFYSWALCWVQYWAGALSRFQKLFLFFAMAPMSALVLYGLFGSKELAILLLSYPAIAFWYARRKMPWLALGAFAVVAVFVIFPLFNTYRNQSDRLGTDVRMSRTIDLAARWDRHEYLDHSVNDFMKRISLVYCVGAILRDVPSAVPYRYGDTLALLPISLFVPRIIWPDKPNITIGREFGVTFQLVNPTDQLTQISPTITGELYWNYDIPGVVVGMFLIGGFMRAVYERYGSGTARTPLRTACYLALLPMAIHFEGNVAGMVAGLLKSMLILSLVFMVARRWRLVEEAPTPFAGGSRIS